MDGQDSKYNESATELKGREKKKKGKSKEEKKREEKEWRGLEEK